MKNKKGYMAVVLTATFAMSCLIFANTKAAVSGSWKQKDGFWQYYENENKQYRGWLNLKGDWYYLDKGSANMLTGWQIIDNSKYYFNTKTDGIEGKMLMGWYKSPKGDWYFLNNDKNSNKAGIVRIGWQWIDGYCYYFDTNPNNLGRMYADTVSPDGFRLDKSGRWIGTNGEVQYISGKGFNTKNTDNKTNLATNRGASGTPRLGSGGGGSSGGRGGSAGSGSLGSGSGNTGSGGSTGESGLGAGSGNTPKQPEKPKEEAPQEPKQPEKPKEEAPQEPKKPEKPKEEAPQEPKKPEKPKEEAPQEPKKPEKPKEDQVPARVELWDNDIRLQNISIDKNKFEESNAQYRLYDVSLPYKYSKNADEKTKFPDNLFTVKVYNKDEKLLNVKVQGTLFYGLNISLPDYHDARFGNGSISLRFKFEPKEDKEEEKPDVDKTTNMEKVDIFVDGVKHTYYYKQYDKNNANEVLKVNGEDISAKAGKIMNYKTPVAHYYVAEDRKLSGNIYGRATVGFADFYASELNPYLKKPANKEPDVGTENFIISGYRGIYKDIERKSFEGFESFKNANYEKFKSGSGYYINGIKIPVQVDAELYAKAVILGEISKKEKPGFVVKGKLIGIIASMTAEEDVNEDGNIKKVKRTLSTNEPNVYKELYANGSLSELKNKDNVETVTLDGHTTIFTDQSEDPRYDYQITIENLPKEIDPKSNVLGVIITMDRKDGKGNDKFGMLFDENISSDSNKLFFSVHRRATGSGIHYQRYQTMEGKNIKSITYLLKDNKKAVIDGLNIYVPKQIRLAPDKEVNVSDKKGFKKGEGASVDFDLSVLPYKEGVKVAVLYKMDGNNKVKLTENTDYTFDGSTLKINDTAVTGAGDYKIIFGDVNITSGYVSYAKDFNIENEKAASQDKGEDEGSKDAVSAEGEEQVINKDDDEDFGYKAKVLVKYDKKTGVIISVEDKTVPDSASARFWKKLINKKLFDKFKGKTKDNLESVDAVSGATWSRYAVIEAIKKAMADGGSKENKDNREDGSHRGSRENKATDSDAGRTRTVTGKAWVDQFGYRALVAVTYDIKSGEIVSVKDNGTYAGEKSTPYWKSALKMTKDFEGRQRTKDDIENVDIIGGATYSSRGIKDAVKDALGIDD